MVKVGDKVKFLNDVGGGIVTSFINRNMVNVENDDGFEIPYPVSQLVNVSAPELNVGFVERENLSAQPVIIREPIFETPQGEIINGKDSPDFYFCFVPANVQDTLNGDIELFLINDSNFTLLYNYSHVKTVGATSVKYGTVPSNSKIKLESFVQNDLSDLPGFGFQILYFKNEGEKLNAPVVKKFKINPVKFYKESTFQSNSFFQKNALILQITPNPLQAEMDKLTHDDFKKVVRQKEANPKPQKKVGKRTPDEVEIDLHINELLDNAEGLSNREILEIQMEKVESGMKLAIQNHIKRIVFIHGVGQGVLKQEVAKLLKSKFKKYYFQDASFKEYGYGATMVILRRG